MEEQIAKLTEDCSAEIASAASESELYSVKVRYLGKSGLISELMKGMRNVPPEQRPGWSARPGGPGAALPIRHR